MRFLTIYKHDEKATRKSETGVPPSQEEITKMGAFIEEMTRSGNLVSTEGCMAGLRLRPLIPRIPGSLALIP